MGDHRGTITCCFSTGNVSSSGIYVGGLAGENWNGNIDNSYATGSVTGGSQIGGLVGWHGYSGYKIENCYSTGLVSGDSAAGGLIGVNGDWLQGRGIVSNSYYDRQTSGRNDSDKGIPKYTTDMKRKATYGSWDFSNIWKIREGSSYPLFQWQGIDEDISLDLGVLTWDYIKGSNTDPSNVTTNLHLPGAGANGTSITWSVVPPEGGWLNPATGAVIRPGYSAGDQAVTLSATVSKSGGTPQEKEFSLIIKSLGISADEAITLEINALTWERIKGANLVEGSVTSNLTLPLNGANGTTISWSVSPPEGGWLNPADGTVTRPGYSAGEQAVTLTATVSKSGGTPRAKNFQLTIKALGMTVDEAITLDINALTWEQIRGDNLTEGNITTGLSLPLTGANGTTISWSVVPAEAGWLNPADGTVTRPGFTDGDQAVTLTATVSKTGGSSQNKSFSLTIRATWEGNGTSDNPYKVVTAAHLNDVRNHPGSYFLQTADINLSAYPNWEPVGPFTGNFDGNGYTIKNLAIDRPNQDNVGLFGSIDGGVVNNLHIEGAGVTGKANVGILAGFVKGGGIVGNSSVTGVVSGATRVGGLAGDVESNLNNKIEDSCAEAQVTCSGDYAGGLVGNNRGTINRCFSTGEVNSSNGLYVGGLAGDNWNGNIQNSYATGSVTGRSNVGGLVGWHGSTGYKIENCYSTGQVNGTTDVGGLIGVNGSGSVTGSYYLETAAIASEGGTKLTSARLKQQASFAGWDFGNTWKIGEDVSYPTLQWQPWTADERISADSCALSWDAIKAGNATIDNVTTDLNLPALGAIGATISWTASPEGWINTTTGMVTRPGYQEENKTVALTARFSYPGGTSREKVFTLTIIKGSNPTIASIRPVDNVSVAYNTSLAAALAQLAPTTTITDSLGNEHTVTLSWSIAGYNSTMAGDYTATGAFDLPPLVDQTDPATELKVIATVTVQAEPASLDPAEVNYDLAAPGDVFTVIRWGSSATSATSVTGVAHANEPMTLDTHYTIDAAQNKLTIKYTFLSGLNLAAGETADFDIQLNDGSVLILTVNIIYTPSGDAGLSGLTISAGSLTPAFAPEESNYTVNVDNRVTSMDVTPTTADSKATVKVNGTPVTSGNAASISLSPGSNTIIVEVTAENQTVKTYTLTVNREAPVNAASFVVTAPDTTRLGQPFEVKLTVMDAGGQIATGYSGTVRLYSTDHLAILPAEYTFTPDDHGEKTFSVTLGSEGEHTLTVAEPAAGGLLGHWKFDEGSGAAVSDSSGNNNHGMLVNYPAHIRWTGAVPPFSVTNPYGLDFFGTDGYVDAGRGINLAQRSFSVAVWAQNQKDGKSFILSTGTAQMKNNYLHIGFRDKTTFTCDFYSNVKDTAAPGDGRWHHWTVTYNNTTGDRVIYCDGKEIARDIADGALLTSGPLHIARNYDAQKYRGLMDDLRIYDRELSPAEAAYLAGGNLGLLQATVNMVNRDGYSVCYYANGGTGTAPVESDKNLGETFTIAPVDSFKPPAGHQFKEWNTKSDGTGASYAAGITIAMPAGDLTLYAIWEPLTWQGNGTAQSPYQVESAIHLDNVRNKMGAGIYFEQTVDIDLSGYANWSPIGASGHPFLGHYDGKRYTIRNLVINTGSDDQGLFGYLGAGNVVKNLNIEEAEINSTGYDAGILAGSIFGGTVEKCSTSGQVHGNFYAGGLVGYVHNNAMITGSFSTADVTAGGNYSGGLVGNLQLGTIQDCYATGQVSGGWFVGGLIGQIMTGDSKVERCYAAGKVTGSNYTGGLIGDNDCGAPVHNSFYDSNTTGQSRSAGGTGKSTADMKKKNTFTYWNFTMWNIAENTTYPFFRWQALYTVNYDANGGAGNPVGSLKMEGETFTIAAADLFTPPNVKVFKEWNTSKDGSGNSYAAGATLTMSAGDLVLYAIWEEVAKPTVPASNVRFFVVTSSSMMVNWTNGNGASRIVLMKEGTPVDAVPINNTKYSASAVFGGAGTEIGAGNFVVYAGSGSLVNVTGLLPEKTYHVAVFEYTGSGAIVNYLVTTPAVGNKTTLSSSAGGGANAGNRIAAGMYHTLALQANGAVAAWGANDYGQCGVPGDLNEALAVAVGGYHSLALTPDGAVKAWGWNDNGQCTLPGDLGEVVAIAAGRYHSLALTSNGAVKAWGRNDNGQCNVPAEALSNVVAVAAGGYHSLALTSEGKVLAWGTTEQYGQCDVPADALSNVVAVAAGEQHSLALTSNGAVKAWGQDDDGQCNVPAGALSNVVSIAAGGSHSVALKSDGKVEAWGWDVWGQCNTSELSGVVALAAGGSHSVYLRFDGTVEDRGYHEGSGVPAGLNLSGRLAGLQLESLSISPAFHPDTLSYQINLSSSIDSLRITAQLENPGHELEINGQPADSGTGVTVDLSPGQSLIPVTVTIPGTGLSRTYNLSFNWVEASSFALSVPVAVKAGEVFRLRLAALDASGQIEKSYQGAAYINWSWPASASPDLTAPVKPAGGPVNFVDGVATVDGFMLTNTGETVMITAESGGNAVTSAPIVVEPNVNFNIEAVDTILIKQPFDVKVTAGEQFGNSITGLTIALGSDDLQAQLPANHTLVESDQGVVTFRDVVFNTAGDRALQVYLASSVLSGYWPFDEESGVMVRDSSGYKNHGALSGAGLGDWTDGAPAIRFANPASLHLDGSDDYVEIPGIDLSNKSFSISFWAKRSGEGQAWIFSQGGSGETDSCLHLGFPETYRFSLAFWGDDLTVDMEHDTEWHHWTVTYNYADQTRQIFRDGIRRGAGASTGHLQSSGPVLVGKRLDGSYFGGNIDDLRIYYRVLSDEEIRVMAGGDGVIGEVSSAVKTIDVKLPPPTLLNAATDRSGKVVKLIFDQAMTGPAGQIDQFSVTVNGIPRAIEGLALSPLDPALFELALTGEAVEFFDIVTVSYTAGDVISAAGDPLASFTGKPVYTFASRAAADGMISAGNQFSLALSSDGTIEAWGYNNEDYNQCIVPPGLGQVVAISAGRYHGLALNADGKVGAWGYNKYEQCDVPTGLSGVSAISAGGNHSLALKADGTVVAWGLRDLGQCSPPALNDVVAISAGGNHSLALEADGKVVAWGDDNLNQCKVPDDALSDVVAISAGWDHSLALKSDGSVVAWGKNDHGQCNVPAGLSGVVSISAGRYHSLALKADGTVVSWGAKAAGGTGDYGQGNVPSGLNSVVSIAAGEVHSLVLKADGALAAWGYSQNNVLDIPVGLNLLGKLSDLLVDGASLPAFSPETYAYTIEIPYQTEISLGATLENQAHILKINGAVANSGEKVTVTLQPGINSIPFAVSIPSSGMTRIYMLTVINSALAHSFSVNAPAAVKVGESFSVEISALNSAGKIETGYAGTHTINWSWTASSSTAGVEPVKPADVPVVFTRGKATVEGFLLTKFGEQVLITATAPEENNISGITGSPVTAVNGDTSGFIIELPADIEAGQPVALTVRAVDMAENPVDDYTDAITFASNDPGAVLPDNYTFTSEDAGVKTFSVTFGTFGEQTLTVNEITDEFKGYWRFDEGSGSEVRDSSGGNKTGAFKGTGTVWSEGAPGTSFTNTHSVQLSGGNDYIEIPEGIDLANKSFSISFWAKRARSNVQEWILFQGTNAVNEGLHIGFRDNGKFSFAFFADDLDVEVTNNTDWHHWAVTYDAATKTQQVFQDGILCGSRTTGSHLNSTGALIIGKRFDGIHFKGNIDDLQVYNRVLSTGDISALSTGSAALPYGKAAISVTGIYTLSYHANGGTGEVPPASEKTAGATFTVAAADSLTPPAGKQFKEWNTAQDGTGTGYATGATVTMPANALLLYAIWEDTTAVALESIEVTTPPAKTTYYVGEALDLSGLVVTGTYSDGSTAVLDIGSEHISGFDSSAAASGQTVIVTYEGKTATFTVDIVAAPVTSATITPEWVTFDLDNPADVSTMITWGSARSVTGVVYDEYTLDTPGDYTVDENALTINEGYLVSLELLEGNTVEFEISFDAGNSAVLAVEAVRSYTPGSDAYLSDLTVGGDTVSGFVYTTYLYTRELPYGTLPGSPVATVGATPKDPKAIVTVTQALQLPGDATVQVVAEDGTTTQTYTVRFTLVEPALTYTIAPIGDQTLADLTAGYAPGTEETRSITITRTGTGELANLKTALSGDGADNFEISQPAIDTLDAGTTSTTFTIKAKHGLPAGIYTATVTVSANNMEDVTFTVRQTVNAEQVTCTVTITPPENGIATGGGTYYSGTSVTLNAIPNTGYNFDGWYGGETKVSLLPNYTFTVTKDVTLTPVFITMPKSSLEVTIVGNGSVKLNNEAGELPSNYKDDHARGTSIRLTATADTGHAFAYWEDINSSSIISTKPVYQCIMGSGVKVKAVFSKLPTPEDTHYTVIFKGKSGKILKSTSVEKGTAATPPGSEPALVGYVFTGWDQTFNNITSDMTINALFVRLSDTYMVTVVNGTLSTGGTSGAYQFDTRVTVVADTAPSGQKFSHWEQAGTKVSTNETYTFYALMKNITLAAVYVDESATIVDVPFITLSEDVLVDKANKTMMFIANRTVPDGYTLVESGIMLLQTNEPLSSELTIDTPNAIRGKIKNDSTDQFYIRKLNIEEGDTWYARAYLIYKDTSGNIIIVYSSNTVEEIMEV
ncbi:MAG: cadherin-like beta sandwich domain-containing protein [Desulfotomaculaceae bacterium]|nr:cadherin-like beta sandwich domain-containing protein [Desulfotomaculaceae bacterium]